MDYKIGRSDAVDVSTAIDEACQGLQVPKFMWFTAGVKAFADCSLQLHEKFPKCLVMGTTSIAAYSREGHFHDALEGDCQVKCVNYFKEALINSKNITIKRSNAVKWSYK